MPTNLALDDELIAKAQKLGGHKSKRVAVNTALQQYVQRLQQMQIVELFGTIDFDPTYDYKAERRAKR